MANISFKIKDRPRKRRGVVLSMKSLEIEMPKPIRINEITGIWTFLKSIDWSERWFLGLFAFHVTCLMLTILTHRTHNLQMVLFVAYLALVYFSERINEWAASNWKLFAKQQYFDSNGLFISTVFSTPLLINCLIILLSWLWSTANLFIRVKKAELRHHEAQVKEEQTNKDK